MSVSIVLGPMYLQPLSAEDLERAADTGYAVGKAEGYLLGREDGNAHWERVRYWEKRIYRS